MNLQEHINKISDFYFSRLKENADISIAGKHYTKLERTRRQKQSYTVQKVES